MSHPDAFGRIVASLHEAARDDALWPTTSAMIDEVCRTKGNMLTFRDEAAEGETQIFYTRFCFRGQRDRELEHEYFGVYFPSDERIPRLTQLPDSQLVHVTDLYSYPERRTSMAYNEALARGKCQNGLNVRLDGPDDSHIVWTIADPVEGRWSSDQIGVIERLLPHLRQFVLVRHALADALALGTSLTGLLDNTHAGVIQLDRRGGIVAANDRAMNVLLRREGLVDQGGFLRATSPADDPGLQRLLARALPRFWSQGESGSMTVGHACKRPRLVLHVSPVEDRGMEFRPRRVAALVFIVDPRRRRRIDRGLLTATLGLTPAESEVAALLAEGRALRDIAVATGRTENTVRWHKKRIFKKLGISRQLEVAQLVLTLADVPSPQH